ncbi:MAG: hypothetical protein US11_C0001G0151 [Candidatus Roizmanbacteria bacterium GW2011_GWA2_36_23]|uniref:Uncharacterized protein n=1 Tax=Candidatus Roizmanbacteria bacterium GW2011_GWA2_36_23 TaxID=1618480 RepID=A0A0G0E9L8_9BACT|nr:MAG: hypothetical protein US11_C0001G0151 [Candidatus Roizmanbacteria bacterium GW2011_GWA2_36_23]
MSIPAPANIIKELTTDPVCGSFNVLVGVAEVVAVLDVEGFGVADTDVGPAFAKIESVGEIIGETVVAGANKTNVGVS